MKIFCITNNKDLEIGLKLAGCDGITLENQVQIEKKIDEVVNNKEIEILVISTKAYEIAKQKVDFVRQHYKLPLITII